MRGVTPAQVWQAYIDDECGLKVAGVVDVLILLHDLSLFFFFSFLRHEFLRYQDATLYQSIANYAEG